MIRLNDEPMIRAALAMAADTSPGQ